MGIHDRDYARDRASARRERPGRGVAVWSVNTWLIVLCAVVFIVNNLVLSQPGAVRTFSYGVEFYPGVSLAEQRRAVRATRDPLPYPGVNGVVYYPLVDPMSPPMLRKEIGRERRAVMPVLTGLGHFSTTQGFFGLEVWRFVTFQFLHQNLTHLLLNMLGLYFVGSLVEQYLGPRRYAAFYLTCGIFGALLYLLLNLLGYVLNLNLPFVLFNDPSTPLVGASAGIFGVLMAAAFISPREEVLIFWVIPVQLRVAVYLFATIAAVNLFAGTSNAGGEAAHVGGAIAGFYFIRRTHLLRDFFDITGDSRRPPAAGRAPARPDAAELDRVLTKIQAEGRGRLTEREIQVLRDATAARGGGSGTPSGGG
ncbi:MAG: rhomboid family intramembrane serine protease [Phycisphaerae bacterium]|nr:rhomboid family intramembrane serine protease [Phycisphaerae bacterium]